MKELETLVQDIEKILKDGVEVPEETAKRFGNEMGELLVRRFKRDKREATLRMSSIGRPDRQLWYDINTPHLGEELHPNSHIKFFIGDIIEAVVLCLAELAGHSVEGQQDEMSIAGIKGHRDAAIDGVTVDVKSASPFSFKKFKEGLTHDKDAFGYITQLQSYIHAAKEDEIVTDKDRGAFVAVNKVTGDIVVDVHKKTQIPIEDIYEHKKQVVKLPEPPERCYEDEPMGKSGNRKLGINCSYCPYKFSCWDGLRGFLYSTGPVFLTHVEEVPRVPEINDEDNSEDET